MKQTVSSKIKALFSDEKVDDQQLNELKSQLDSIKNVMAVIEFTSDGKVLAVNENFLKVIGYAESEMVGKHHRQFAESAFVESKTYQDFWHKLAKGEFDQGQYKWISSAGNEIWFEARYYPVLDENGQVYKVVKYATDITSKMEEQLDLKGQIQAINKSQGTIELGLDGKVITANENFLAVLGYSLDEAVGQHHRNFVSAEYAESQEYQDFWAALNRGEYISGRFQRVGKSGRNIWLQASYNPIFGADGKPYKVVKFATEITEQVEFEAQAKMLSLVTDETDNSVLITNAEGLIEYVNHGFEALTGYTAQEVKGKKFGTFLGGELTEKKIIAQIQECLKSGEAMNEDVLIYNKSGQPYWISLALNPVVDDAGKLDKFVAVQTNINDTKVQTLEYLSKLDAISKVSAVIEFTPEGIITDANENFTKTVGYDLDEIKGKHHRIFVEKNYSKSDEYAAFWEKLKGGQPDTGQYHRVGNGDKDIWLEASYNPIFDQNGIVVKVVKFATDISKQHFAQEALEAAVDESKAVIDAAKSGDISNRIDVSGKSGELASLCGGINDLLDNMKNMLGQISEASETINTAAGEIASGNTDLSSRTEQQASNLQVTVNSMDELSTTVKQNADQAKRANKLADDASGVAVKGGEVVGEVVTTMAGINESARKIEDIISVIGGIAFQTNILALNAAVEAARAGEQGRGFAVVAGEVRNLAQRSSSAAKEIKDLIGDSVGKVQEGTKLEEDAGNTMTEIVDSVQSVTDIMRGIATASEEQSAGIEQINQSVTSVEDATQQNAALVEEAAAAAESLVEQANGLMSTVKSYRLGGSQTPVAAPTANNTRTVKAPVKERRSSNSPMRGGSNTKFSLLEAEKAHGKWKMRLIDYINGRSKEELHAEDLCKDDQCPLGKWIYGEALEHQSLEQYKHLRAEHKKFHTSVGSIVEKVKSNQTSEAKSLLGGDFSKHSKATVDAIQQMQRAIDEKESVVQEKTEVASNDWEEF